MKLKTYWNGILLVTSIFVASLGTPTTAKAAMEIPPEGQKAPFFATDKNVLKGLTVTTLPRTAQFDTATTDIPKRAGGLSAKELSRMICGHLYHSLIGSGAQMGNCEDRTSAGHLLIDVQIAEGKGMEHAKITVAPCDTASTEAQAMAAEIGRMFGENLTATGLPGTPPEVVVATERPADRDKTVVVTISLGDLNTPAFEQWMARRGSWNTVSEGIYKGVAAVWQAKKDEFASRVKPFTDRVTTDETTTRTLAEKCWKAEKPPVTEKELQGALDTFCAELSDRTFQYFDVTAHLQGEIVELRGTTNMPVLQKAAEQLMYGLGRAAVRNEIRLLPAPHVAGKFGTVRVSDAFLWGTPKEGTGVQTQLLLGEPVMILDSTQPGGEFLLVMGGDGYTGWIRAEAVLCQTAEEFAAYHNREKAVLTRDVTAGTSVTLRLPASAELPIAERVGSDGLWKLGLPDGTQASVSGSVLNMIEGRGTEAATAAMDFLCTPYVFGGLSRTGMDCSGLVNTAWGSVGLTLPRNAFQQGIVGRLVATPWYKDAMQPGDILFFMDSTGRIFHTGISIGGKRYIHSAPPQVQINSFDPADPLYSKLWAECFVFARRPLR